MVYFVAGVILGGLLGWAGGWIHSIMAGKENDHEILAQVAQMIGQINALAARLDTLEPKSEEKKQCA